MYTRPSQKRFPKRDVGSSPTFGTYLNQIIDKISTHNPSSDKKTLVVSNESVLNMDFHLVVY